MTTSYTWDSTDVKIYATTPVTSNFTMVKSLSPPEAAALLTAKEAQVESLARQIDELKAQLAATNTDRVYMIANKTAHFHVPDLETADWFMSQLPPSAGMEVGLCPVLRKPDAERLRLKLIGYAYTDTINSVCSRHYTSHVSIRKEPSPGDIPIFRWVREGDQTPTEGERNDHDGNNEERQNPADGS